MLGQSWPKAVSPPMPVTTTRRIEDCIAVVLLVERPTDSRGVVAQVQPREHMEMQGIHGPATGRSAPKRRRAATDRRCPKHPPISERPPTGSAPNRYPAAAPLSARTGKSRSPRDSEP